MPLFTNKKLENMVLEDSQPSFSSLMDQRLTIKAIEQKTESFHGSAKRFSQSPQNYQALPTFKSFLLKNSSLLSSFPMINHKLQNSNVSLSVTIIIDTTLPLETYSAHNLQEQSS